MQAINDPAFVWDRDRALSGRQGRASPARPSPSSAASPVGHSARGRISLREAERRHGIAVRVLRAWCRDSLVDAIKMDGRNGRQWMVAPDSIVRHSAGVIARTAREVDTQEPQTDRPTTKVEAPETAREGSVPEGSMLVPRDAWHRILDQLGNLHIAGQELAEARERAVRAETEVAFLRERLADIRAQPPTPSVEERRDAGSQIGSVGDDRWRRALRTLLRRR